MNRRKGKMQNCSGFDLMLQRGKDKKSSLDLLVKTQTSGFQTEEDFASVRVYPIFPQKRSCIFQKIRCNRSLLRMLMLVLRTSFVGIFILSCTAP